MPIKYIGVVAGAQNCEVVKRAALLCDTLICNGVGDATAAVELGILSPTLSTEAGRLLDFIPSERADEATAFVDTSGAEVLSALSEVSKYVDRMTATADSPNGKVPAAGKQSLHSLVNQLRVAVFELGDLYTRFHAELMRFAATDNIYIPIIYGSDIPSVSPLITTRAEALRVILYQLPLPSNDTPWEAIRDWRNDAEAREKYLVLRAWISRLARERLNSSDIEEEIAAKLATYQSYMAVQHKKMQRSRFEAIILPLAQAAEDALRLRLSSAAEKLVGLFRQELTVLESELTAPGREIAYIATSHDRFGRTGGLTTLTS